MRTNLPNIFPSALSDSTDITNEIEERINAGKQVDYLQVFNISVIDEVRGIVKIEHIQEVPEYKKTLIIKSKGVKSNLKVFVTFESEYATMMLASEY